jgi:hypothetical protein
VIELFFLLIGARVVRRKWWIPFVIGSGWLALGAFFFVDAFFDTRIPATYFAAPLLIDAIVSTIAALQTAGTERSLRFGKAGLLMAIVLVLIVEAPWHEDMIVGILAGIFMVTDAGWRATSAYVVRFARWRLSIAGATLEFLMGVWSFIPWPTNWAGEAEGDVGLVIMATAAGLLSIALRLRQLPPGMPLSTVLTRGWPTDLEEDESPVARAPWKRESGTVTVHIWTPTGDMVPVGVRRYVAAVNKSGGVSAGHAALDVPPDVYISHYPAVEISRAPADFAQTLRATPDNDVEGLFQPSYAQESAEWCPSTMRVRLDGLDVRAIRSFWKAYRRDTTYNLTNRNCSSVVAKALDAGIEGLFEHRARSPYFLMRLLFLPELWVAGVLRRRAAAMAWTPGLMLDYARGLAHVIRLPQALAADRRPRAKTAG